MVRTNWPYKAVYISLFALSVAVIAGWIFEIDFLKSIQPDLPSMKFNTAVCMALCALSAYFQSDKRFTRLSIALPLVVFLISIVTLVETYFELSLGLNTLLFDPEFSNDLPPEESSRMSVASAICFILLSLKLMLRKARIKNINVYLIFLSYGLLLLSGISLIAYLFQISDDSKISIFRTMALHTSFAFFTFSVILPIESNRIGLWNLFFSNQLGSRYSRRLFLIGVSSLVVLGFFIIQGSKLIRLDLEFGISILVIFGVCMLSILNLHVSKNIDKIDLQLQDNKERLREKITEVAEIRGQIDQITRREQERLSKFLHDGIGQELTALTLQINIMMEQREEEVYQKLGVLKRNVKYISSRIRDVSHELRSADVQNSSLQELVSRLEKFTGIQEEIKFRYVLNIQVKDDDIPKNIKIDIYRTLQESITNIMRHSNADRATVIIEQIGHELHISISDNGRGGNPESNNYGIGLKNISERIRSNNGSVEFHGDKGWMVSAVVPLPVEVENPNLSV